MKNTFKLMGLALLAGTLMFTACKKDDKDDSETKPVDPQPTVAANFDGQQLPIAYSYAVISEESNMFELAASQDSNAQFNIIDMAASIEGTLENKKKDEWVLDGLEYTSDRQYMTTDEDSLEWGEWVMIGNGPEEFVYDSFDPTTLKLTTSATAKMYNFYTYYHDQDDGVRKVLTVNAANIPLEVMPMEKTAKKAKVNPIAE